MSHPRLIDVREEMPRRGELRPRSGEVTGIAIHHSATANAANGLGLDDARSIFEHHVHRLGWSHGGYHYCVLPNGRVEYCLDESVGGYHAGFADPDDEFGLEHGQYWNEHFLAVCVVGWFEVRRSLPDGSTIPDHFVQPTVAQWGALCELVADLIARYRLMPAAVRGHRDLDGCRTRCPGDLDVASLIAELGVVR